MPDVFEAPLAAAPLDEGLLTVSPARLLPPSALYRPHSRQRRALLPMSAGVEITARGGLRLNHHYPSDERHHMHHHHHHHLDPHSHHRRRPAAAAVRCLADIDRTMRANERWVLLNKETFQEIFDATLHEMTRTPEELLDEAGDPGKKRGRSPAVSDTASDGDSSNNNNIISNNNKTHGYRRNCSSSECSSGAYSEPEQDVTPSSVTSPSACRSGPALTATAPTESAKLTVALSDITNDGQGQQRYQNVAVTSQTASGDSSVPSPVSASQQVGPDRENEPLDLSMNRSPSVEVVASPGSDRAETLASTSSSSSTTEVSATSQKQAMACVTSATTSNVMSVSSMSNVISRPGRVSPGRASGNGGSDEPHHQRHRHRHHQNHHHHHNTPSHSSAVPMPLAASGAGGSSGAPCDLKAASPRGSGSSGGSVCLVGPSANKIPARRGSLPAAAGGGGSSGSGRSASPRDRPTSEVAAATLSPASRAMTTSSPLLSSRPAATLANMKARGENWVPFNKDAVYGIVEDVIHQLEDQKGSDIKAQSTGRSADTVLKSKMPSSPNSYSSAPSKSHHRLDKRGMNDFSGKPSRRASPVDSESCSGSEECVSGDDSNGSNSRLHKPRPARGHPGSSIGVYDTHVGKQNSLVPMCNFHSRRVSGASSAVVGGGQTSQEGGIPIMDTAAEGDHALPTPLTDRHLVSGVISASGASTQSGSANSSPTSKVKQCWVALDKMFVFDIVDSAMRKADDTKGDSDDGSSDGRHAQAKDPAECAPNTKVDSKASETSASGAGKGPPGGAVKEGPGGGGGRCLKRRNEGANDKVCVSKKRREGGGQDSGVTSPLPAPTAPHSPNNALCSSGHGRTVNSASSQCHTVGKGCSPHLSCLEDLLAESNSQKVGTKTCGDRSTPHSPQVSQRNSPVARELGNMHLGVSQGTGIDQASSEKVATAKQENIKGAHALTPVIRTLCSMSENNQCAPSDTKESDGGTHARGGGGRREAVDVGNDVGNSTKHGLVPLSASSTKDARSSPRLGWIAVSKIEVHNIFDSVVDSMIADDVADDVVTSSPVRSDIATAQSPVPSSSASTSSSAGRQGSPASSPLPARDADSSTAASPPPPPSSAGSSSDKQQTVDRTQSPLGVDSRESGAQSPLPASPQSPRSPGEAHDRNSDLRSTKAFKWKSSLLMRVNEENKPDVAQLPAPANTAHARGSSSKQKNDSKSVRCGRRAGTTRKHTK